MEGQHEGFLSSSAIEDAPLGDRSLLNIMVVAVSTALWVFQSFN